MSSPSTAAEPPCTHTDGALLKAHLAGDPQAFNEIVRRHRASLWLVAYRTLRNHHDAEDAVQTALLKAFRRADSWRGDADLLPWLRAVVANTSITLLNTRSSSKVHAVGTDPEVRRGLTAPDGVARVDTDAVLQQYLSQLPRTHQVAFFLVALRGFSVAEVARLEGVAEGTIKSRVWRARAQLITQMHSSE